MMLEPELGASKFSSVIGDDVENFLLVPVVEERWKLSGDAISIVVLMGDLLQTIRKPFVVLINRRCICTAGLN